MDPAEVVIPGLEGLQKTIAKDQPEYRPLPALINYEKHTVLTRWTLTPDERRLIADGADFFLLVLGIHGGLQPVLPAVVKVAEGNIPANLSAVHEALGDYAGGWGGPDRLADQVDELAAFIIREVPDEPSASEGTIPCAIRCMREMLDKIKAYEEGLASIEKQADGG